MNQASFVERLVSIIERIPKYQKLLRYPREGTERMLRGWIAMEVLLCCLGWNPQNIVFGETFDLLLVDDRTRPVLYIETKSLGQKIDPDEIPSEMQKILKRTGRRPTLKRMIVTNGIKWIMFDLSGLPKASLELQDIRKAKPNQASLLEKSLSPYYYTVREDDYK